MQKASRNIHLQLRAVAGLLFLFLFLAARLCPAATAPEGVLVEAESFADKGGWVVDQQFMDQMGSPYLLAHGMGRPVAEAKQTVAFPRTGTYHLWVRTWNWASPWTTQHAPGQFQVRVDGKLLDRAFGTEGAEWGWRDGGTVEIGKEKVELSLHDLTGFDGRCDALFFSLDPQAAPPNRDPEMAAFRKQALGLSEKPEEAGPFDLVVVGGGIAGTCAAISGARLGLQVALIQDRPVLGGNNSSEVRVHVNGKTLQEPYPALGAIVEEIRPARQGNAQPAAVYEDEKKLRVVQAEPNLKLFLNWHANAVEKEGTRIRAIRARHIETGREMRFPATFFADCTGDATIGFLAGADWRMGREGQSETREERAAEKPDSMVMGSSVQWYSRETDQPSVFPACPWALAFNEENHQPVTMGEWDWETGMRLDQIADFERIRDHGLRVVYGNWDFLKNHAKNKAQYARRELDWVAYVAGKRESRRLLGDVILCQQDVVDGKPYPDAAVTTTWTIDLHFPEPRNAQDFPGQEFRSIAKHTQIKPYPVPYRSLYSRNVENLFMAGRNISVTHVALGTVRVMGTGGMMGEVVGMAASLAKQHATTPRGVYEKHLTELQDLMRRGVGKKGE